MELDYYHQKLNVSVDTRVAERLKTKNLKKQGHFSKISKLNSDIT